MLLWMHEPADRDAMIIKDALRCVNLTRQNRILAEIFCTRSVEEIHSITNAYASQNKGKSLLNEIESRVIDPPSREVRLATHENDVGMSSFSSQLLHDIGMCSFYYIKWYMMLECLFLSNATCWYVFVNCNKISISFCKANLSYLEIIIGCRMFLL